ncbi:MAG: GDP-mannose 4,6-dehydratase [Candidatus Pacebacteria bacterium]|nr:GDP-mannose 4,6-dehydratase [Candidatus Paceibacterota bacterium]
MKTALITGITGQDGSYLAEYLLSLGYAVYGFVRPSSFDPNEKLEDFLGKTPVKLVYGDLRDLTSIERALREIKPDEIYNLAAQSHVGVSFKAPETTWEINYHGVGRLVHAIMHEAPNARLYQASTSEMFGSSPPPQSETTPFHPVSPYAEAKMRAHLDFIVGYRERENRWNASGILFNHESPRRGKTFVTRKITIALSKIKLGVQDILELGNLDAKRDWGFAGDYVKAMHKILQQPVPKDYVIGTGEYHSVRDFVNAAAKTLDMSITWEGTGANEIGIDTKTGKVIVRVNREFFRPTETSDLLADPTRAHNELDWKPEVNFGQLVEMMSQSDFQKIQKTL